MSYVSFRVDKSKYKGKLDKATETAIAAVAEQALTDSNEYVKYDTGALHDSARVELDGTQAALTWNTPYALRQYYTGTPIDHGVGQPLLQWAHKAEKIHGKEWAKIAQKAFGGAMR